MQALELDWLGSNVRKIGEGGKTLNFKQACLPIHKEDNDTSCFLDRRRNMIGMEFGAHYIVSAEV